MKDPAEAARQWIKTHPEDPYRTLLRDLANEVDRWRPCEPCRDARHDDCTGYCLGICCQVEESEAEAREYAAVVTRLRDAADLVVKEWDERGDGGCTLVIQNELRAALTTEQGDQHV